MKHFLQSRRARLLIFWGFIAFSLFILFITHFATSMKVIEFAFLTISCGFAPAYYFRGAFRFKGIVGWLTHAGALGLLLIPFLFLFLGWLRINVIFEYSVRFLFLCSLIGILSLVFFAEEKSVKAQLTFCEIGKVDIFIAVIFLAFTAILTLQNFDKIHTHWDTFTFWGLDARYIFENNQLGDRIFQTDVLIHRYTSFHPLYHSIIYDLYGGIHEQFAAWVNIYINMLAMFLVYWSIIEKSLSHKLVISASILIVSYSAISIVNMLSMYADVLCAFLLFVFFLILTNQSNKVIETFWQRVFLLLLLATSFYFVKSHFIYFTVILVGIWGLYDAKFIIENFKHLIRKKGLWFAVLSVATLWAMRAIYFANIGGISSNEKVDPSFIFQIQTFTLSSLLNYLVDLWQYMVGATPYFLGLWWLTFVSIFFVKQLNKKYIFLYSSALLIFLLPIASYTVRQWDFNSQSLPRYSAIVMYLFPLVLSHVDIVEDKIRKSIALLGASIISIFVFLNIMWPMPLNEKFTLSDGTYQSEMTKYYRYAEKILDRTGAQARVLIADDLTNNKTTNTLIPSIFLRYFMMDNSVGAQYQEETSKLFEYAAQNQADYILLLSYSNAFDACGQLFASGHDYLIDLQRGSPNQTTGACPFSSSVIQDLGAALK